MEIILQGQHNGMEAVATLQSVMQLLSEHYRIQLFREIHMSITLVDDFGQEVELVDHDTNQVYGVIEISREPLSLSRRMGPPGLKLVVDNTEKDIT
jgi:hypothetical protein